MKFYKFRQNNSGGSFDVSDQVSIVVLIQADSADEANNLAEDVGIYFNGVENGNDCECCGDRWSTVWGTDNDSWSCIKADSVEEVIEKITKSDEGYSSYWVKDGKPWCYIYTDVTKPPIPVISGEGSKNASA